jgi:hypothetical protein
MDTPCVHQTVADTGGFEPNDGDLTGVGYCGFLLTQLRCLSYYHGPKNPNTGSPGIYPNK